MNLVKKVIAALLCIILGLSVFGCSLVTVDKEADLGQAVATVNGIEIPKSKYQSQYETFTYYYSMFGQDVTDPEVIKTLQQTTLDSLIETSVIMQKSKELGLDKMTDEEKATSEKEFGDMITQYLEQYRAKAVEQLGEDATEDELLVVMNKLLDDDLATQSMTREDLRTNYDEGALYDKLQAYINNQIQVSDEDVKTWYDTELASQQAALEKDSNSYATEAEAGTALVAPEGFAYYRQILVGISTEDTTKITDEEAKQKEWADQMSTLIVEDKTKNATAIDELEASINTSKSAVSAIKTATKTKAEDVLSQLQSGADFNTLLEQYNTDEGMKSEPTKSAGYLVGKTTTTYEQVFTDAANALVNIGDISPLAETQYGYHILVKSSVVEPGITSYDSIKEKCKEWALTQKQKETWTSNVEQWKSEAKIVKNENALTDNSGSYTK